MAELAEKLHTLRLELERRRGQRDEIMETIARSEAKLAAAVDREDLNTKACEVLQTAIEARRQQLHERVESLVTRGLRAVFGRGDLEFFFRTKLTANVVGIIPELRSKFKDREIEIGIVDGHGGGIADVISFLLRVIVLSLTRPKLALFLVLDEPFRHVSLEYLRGCATLVRELCRSAGVQFLIVTHKPDLLDAAEVVYRSAISGGVTTYTLEHDLRDDVFHQRAASVRAVPPPPEAASYPVSDLVGASKGGMSGSMLTHAVEVDARVADDPLSRKQNSSSPPPGPRWDPATRKRWTKEKKREVTRREAGELDDEDPE